MLFVDELERILDGGETFVEDLFDVLAFIKGVGKLFVLFGGFVKDHQTTVNSMDKIIRYRMCSERSFSYSLMIRRKSFHLFLELQTSLISVYVVTNF